MYINNKLVLRGKCSRNFRLRKINRNTRTDGVIGLCLGLIERFGIVTHRKTLQKEAKEKQLEGTKPHIGAGLLFVPQNFS